MGKLGSALLFAWELPQNVLGAALFAVETLSGTVREVERGRGRLFIESTRTAVSLGTFVFWARGKSRWFILDEHTRAHEYGHSSQSRWLGPLYLPLVGVPSALRAAYAVAYREVTGRRWTGYFDAYPESWADRLGGVPPRKRETA